MRLCSAPFGLRHFGSQCFGLFAACLRSRVLFGAHLSRRVLQLSVLARSCRCALVRSVACFYVRAYSGRLVPCWVWGSVSGGVSGMGFASRNRRFWLRFGARLEPTESPQVGHKRVTKGVEIGHFGTFMCPYVARDRALHGRFSRHKKKAGTASPARGMPYRNRLSRPEIRVATNGTGALDFSFRGTWVSRNRWSAAPRIRVAYSSSASFTVFARYER